MKQNVINVIRSIVKYCCIGVFLFGLVMFASCDFTEMIMRDWLCG